jgi:AhpD family alkylhydroperoxidase
MTATISRLDTKRAVPELYRAMIGLDAAVTSCGLDRKLQELIKFRVAQMNGCAYCMDSHRHDAIAAGERPERLFVVAGWRETRGWFDEREQAALALAEAMTHLGAHGVPDDVYDEAAARFSEAELGALIFLGMTINAWTRLGVTAKMSP